VKEIADKITEITAFDFEKLVLDVLEKMGYGDFNQDRILLTKKSGDEGIDGVIFQDKLGLDVVYVQAKKWDKKSKVGRPEIQKFVGALSGKKANKGVFITSSAFSSEALEFVELIQYKIVLIDGEKLARYMIDINVGVQDQKTYIMKKIDNDYFQFEEA
jgi:restriction system protein